MATIRALRVAGAVAWWLAIAPTWPDLVPMLIDGIATRLIFWSVGVAPRAEDIHEALAAL